MTIARRLERRRSAVAALVAFIAGACLLDSAPARAERGAALDLGEVEITDGLLPGGSYRLPVFSVRNPGDERTTYRMVVSRIQDQKRLEPKEDWFRFEPSQFSLLPERTRLVHVRVDLPTGARPGDYETLLGAQIVTDPKGVQVGAAAASRVSFTVESSTLLGAWWLKARTFLSDHSPWTYLLPSVVLFALAFWQLRRRVSVSVARRT